MFSSPVAIFDAEEARRARLLIRVILGFAAVSIPLVGVAYWALAPTFIDLWWWRALVTVGCAVSFGLTFCRSVPVSTLRHLLLAVALFVQVWLVDLSVYNNYSADVFLYALTVCICVGAAVGYVYASVRATLFLFGFTLTTSILSYALATAPEVPLFVLLSVVVINGAIISLIVYAVLRGQHTLIAQQQVLLSQRQALDDSQRIGQIGSWTFDTETKAVDFSDEARRIFGFSLNEEVTYRTFLRRLDRASFTALRRATIVILHRQPSYTLRQPLHLPSGEQRWLEYTGQTVLVDGRKEIRGTVRDITVQRAQEETLETYQQNLEDLVRERTHELEQQKARYELINRVTTDLIAIHDPEGHYQFVSPSAYEITGYTPEELVGRNAFDLVPEEHVEETLAAYQNGDPRQPITYTTPFRRKDGTIIWSETTARVVFDAQGNIQEIVTIGRDVTARYQEKEALEAQHQADQATLRRNIVTTLPHELRTPLSAIIGFTSVLQHDWRALATDEVDELLNEVQTASDRMESLIEKYTLYAYLIMATPETIEPPAVTTQTEPVAEQIRLAAERRAHQEGRARDLRLGLTADLPAIALPYLSRIIDELTSNALKFSEPGTPVRIAGGVADDRYLITISDQGRGFPSDTCAKIGAFMQFERDHYEQQGTGLGLAIVKQLLRLYGGRWDIQSSPSGTTLSVSLPLMPFAIVHRAQPLPERLAS